MIRSRLSSFASYLGAVGIVMAATLIRLAADPILKDRQPFAVFLAAIVIVARYCGFRPSLLALGLSSVATRYYFLTPRRSLSIPSFDQQTSFAFFLLFGLLFVFLLRSERRTRQALEREIADRKKIEEELRATQDLFHGFVDHGPFAAFIKDDGGKYVYVNKCVERSSQRDSAHWLGKTDYDLFPSAVAVQCMQDDRSVMQGNAALHFDDTTKWPNGTVQYWSTIKFPLQGENGRRLMGGVAVDVTEIRKAGQQSRESEARLLLALDAGRLGLWSWDFETDRVQASETQAVLHNNPPNQTEMNLAESMHAVHPDDKPLLQSVLARSIKNEAPERVTYRVVWADGGTHWIECVGRVFCDESGKPNRAIGVCADITERKVAEIALRESEERFRAFMDHSPAIAWAKDEQGRFIYLNKTYQDQAGLRPDEWLGKTDFDFWPSERAQRFWDSDRRVLADEQPVRITDESVFPGRAGHFWYKTKFVFRDGLDRRYVGGVGIDVTDVKRTEESLRAEQELLRNLLEVQEKEKRFLCHEFHDGLMQYAIGSAMSLASFQEKHPHSEAAATIGPVIENLRKGIEDGRRAIRGIRPTVLDDFGLDAAIEDLIDQFSTCGIMVTSKCDPQIGRLPSAVQTTVYRVVQEALNNAKKYSGTDVVRIELERRNGDLHLDIRDFGCGFDVESGRKKGFGLVGMMERVRLLGGECRIQSELDAGTHISVRLPLMPTG